MPVRGANEYMAAHLREMSVQKNHVPFVSEMVYEDRP